MADERAEFEEWMRAAERGDEGELRARLDAGFRPDARGPSGETALMRAAARGHAAAARLLLLAGADPDLRRRDQWTPLMLAAFFGHADVARVLVAAGADVDATDGRGSNAFQWASARGHVEVAHLLSGGEPAPSEETTQPVPVHDPAPPPAPLSTPRTTPKTPPTPPTSAESAAALEELFARRPLAGPTPAPAVEREEPPGPEATAVAIPVAPPPPPPVAPQTTRPASLRYAAFAAVALVVVGGVALAFKLAGPGSSEPSAAAPAPTTAAADAQTPAAAQVMPVTPIASPSPAESPTPPVPVEAVPVVVTGEQYPSYVVPGAPEALSQQPAPREFIPPNQPAGRPSGGEPSVVNVVRPDAEPEPGTPGRRTQDASAQPEQPLPRPARDAGDDVQTGGGRTSSPPPRPTPTPPRGKVINWP